MLDGGLFFVPANKFSSDRIEKWRPPGLCAIITLMKYFFDYENDLPEGVGFSLFGREHFLWLLVILAGIITFIHFYRKLRPAAQKKASRAVASSVLFLQVIQALFFMLKGVYGIYTLPLHLCSLAAYLIFLHSIFHPRWFSEILFFPLLPGTACALLFPDWTRYPAVSFMSLAGFLVHGFMVLYICMGISDGTVRPQWRKIWIPVLFIFVYALPVIAFDHAFHTNYGFLNVPSPGSPLVFISGVFGTGIGYYAGYAILVFSFLILFYAFYSCVSHYLHKYLISFKYGGSKNG